ncbi:hypothetical protein C6N75_23505 [Streptomyces solincola]|uniref:Uncharacterized protein n=1 Tax=Streptomyces solincola TaxID=2100817 RepID=A0A2S9PR03_9ACTN|nr:hypothetical protein [Streptomyces solincola]PRH76823.1 hypothetical protein C6N75_23505 [Streptomyces solincola]
MTPTKKHTTIAVAVVAVLLAAWSGIGYTTGLPPFEKERGTIKANEVCRSLGSSDDVVDALNRVLPDSSSYSFAPERITPRGTGRTDNDFDAHCFVNGDDGRLMTVRTEMFNGAPLESAWQKQLLENQMQRDPKLFTAGQRAFTTSKMAAVYSACLDLGNYGLSTYVRLEQPVPADRLGDLRRLATLAARQAHESADCTEPADAPAG